MRRDLSAVHLILSSHLLLSNQPISAAGSQVPTIPLPFVYFIFICRSDMPPKRLPTFSVLRHKWARQRPLETSGWPTSTPPRSALVATYACPTPASASQPAAAALSASHSSAGTPQPIHTLPTFSNAQQPPGLTHAGAARPAPKRAHIEPSATCPPPPAAPVHGNQQTSPCARPAEPSTRHRTTKPRLDIDMINLSSNVMDDDLRGVHVVSTVNETRQFQQEC